MTKYVLTTNGHGSIVRPIREHDDRCFATVRADSGAWVSGEVLRVWEDERAAMRDYYRPQIRKGRKAS